MTGAEPGAGRLLAPGCQATLFPAPSPARQRWWAVHPDGTRLPPVAQLGVAVAQALAIADACGAAWIVGADEHTVEIRRTPAGPAIHTADNDAPRWTAVVATAARPPRRPSTR